MLLNSFFSGLFDEVAGFFIAAVVSLLTGLITGALGLGGE